MKKSFIRSFTSCASIASMATLGLLGLGCGTDATMQPPSIVPDTAVWNSAVTTLVVTDEGGGFAPQGPPGSNCALNAQKYILTVATKGLSWTRCIGSGGGTTPYKAVSGSRVLSDAELKDLGLVLGNLRVVKSGNGCIVDASELTVDVANPFGSQEYIDEGEQCMSTAGPFIDRGAIQSALDSFNKLAGPAS